MDLDAKAERLARGGAVVVLFESEDWPPLLQARVTGETDTYDVELQPDGSASCTCMAATVGHRRCSHIRALRLIEQYGDIWAAEAKARKRMEERDDWRPPGDTKAQERHWPRFLRPEGRRFVVYETADLESWLHAGRRMSISTAHTATVTASHCECCGGRNG